MIGREAKTGARNASKPVGLGRLDEKDSDQDQEVTQGTVETTPQVASPTPTPTPPAVPTPTAAPTPPAPSPTPPIAQPQPTPLPRPAPSASPVGTQPAHAQTAPTPPVKTDLHLLLPGLVGRKTRVPRGFRLDADLLEYLELHEMYRTALMDQRPFVEQLNDWIRHRMVEDTPVLIRAAEALKEVRDQEEAQAQPASEFETGETPEPQAPTVVADETTEPENGHAVSASTPPQSVTPPKKGPSIWDIERQVKRSRAGAGTL